jgi:UDP-N-acetyl-D-mannosaminuronate dehydrogenase
MEIVDVISNKILIVGLGQLGLPVAKYVKEKGFEVFGFDANAEASRTGHIPQVFQQDVLS